MFKNIYEGKKVLITGNTGFKGSWLTIWLLKLGAKIYGISNGVPTNPSMFETLQLRQRITYIEFDLRDLDKTINTITQIKPDFIFHLAAQPIVYTSYKNPVDTISTNVLGTANVLESLRVGNFPTTAIIITSDKCYDNVEWVWGYRETDFLGGKDIYSGSKAAAEMVIKSYYHSFFKDNQGTNVKIISVRAGNVIGGGDWADYRIIPDCIRAWSEGKKVLIRSPKSTRPWQHVMEPLSGYLHAGQALCEDDKLNGESFNFGPKPEYSHSVEEIITDLSKIFKYQDPSDAISILSENKYHEAQLLKLNCDKALYYLNWLPVLEYNDVIWMTGEWYYKYYHEDKDDLFQTSMKQVDLYEHKAFEKGLKWAR